MKTAKKVLAWFGWAFIGAWVVMLPLGATVGPLLMGVALGHAVLRPLYGAISRGDLFRRHKKEPLPPL